MFEQAIKLKNCGKWQTVAATNDKYFRLCHLITEAYVLKYIVHTNRLV